MNISYFPSLVIQNPWAFTALLALALPLVLHLISKSQAKPVKFANIELIDSQQPKSMRQIRLTEFCLLLLRILLLLVSILLLAQAFFTKPLIANEEIYILTPDWLNQSNDRQRQQLVENALNNPTYLLALNTELITADKILQWQQTEGSQHQNILKNLEYFSQLLAAETKIKIFVTDRANQYQPHDVKGSLGLNNPIEWQIHNLVINNYQQYPNAIKVMIIYDQDRFADIKYFQQAFALIKQQIAPELSLSYFQHSALASSARYQQILQNKPDWLFYLSSKSIDDEIVQVMSAGTRLFVDAPNPKEKSLLSNTIIINKHSNALLDTEALFFRRALPLNIVEQLSKISRIRNSEILWPFIQSDGTSLPMLTRTTLVYQSEMVESHVYQLYSRFTPSWSNLLVIKEFPLLLQNLLFEQWQNKIIARQQRLNHQQISQFFTKVDINEESTKVRASEFTPAKSLIVQQQKNADFWLEILAFLLMLLWAIERIASEFFRPKANVGHNQENHKHDSRTIKVTQAIKSAQVDT